MKKIWIQVTLNNGALRPVDQSWDSVTWKISRDGSYREVDKGYGRTEKRSGRLSETDLRTLEDLVKKTEDWFDSVGEEAYLYTGSSPDMDWWELKICPETGRPLEISWSETLDVAPLDGIARLFDQKFDFYR